VSPVDPAANPVSSFLTGLSCISSFYQTQDLPPFNFGSSSFQIDLSSWCKRS